MYASVCSGSFSSSSEVLGFSLVDEFHASCRSGIEQGSATKNCLGLLFVVKTFFAFSGSPHKRQNGTLVHPFLFPSLVTAYPAVHPWWTRLPHDSQTILDAMLTSVELHFIGSDMHTPQSFP